MKNLNTEDNYYVEGIKQVSLTKQIGFILGVLVTLMVYSLIGCGDDEKKPTKNVPDEFNRELIEEHGPEYGISPYETENIHDSINNSLDSVTYWYVQYHVTRSDDNKYDGFEVVKLKTKYFDLKAVFYTLLPDRGDKDYIGINFFKQVPYDTYLSFKSMYPN